MDLMEYYCVIRNDQQVDFRKMRKNLYELMLIEMKTTRGILHTVKQQYALTNLDRLSYSQECKDIRQSQKTYDEKCYPQPEKELCSLNADQNRLFSRFVFFFLWGFSLLF